MNKIFILLISFVIISSCKNEVKSPENQTLTMDSVTISNDAILVAKTVDTTIQLADTMQNILEKPNIGTEKETKTIVTKTPKNTKPPKDIELKGNPKDLPKKNTTKIEVPEPVKESKIMVPLPETTVLTPEEKNQAIEVRKEESIKFDQSHKIWNDLLKNNVNSEGKVNYKGFIKDKQILKEYIQNLTNIYPEKNNFNPSECMAYWINLYNASTIQLITEHYPLKSIMDLDGGKTWDIKRINVNGTAYSLNDIENKILREKYKYTLCHFAVNCAARSCPPLSNSAWTGENLQEKAKESASKFINNSKFNVINEKEIKLSKIFDWYKDDFGNIYTFLETYHKQINKQAKLTYLDYDWSLNE